MNKILVVVCAVVISLGAVGASAQTPTVQPYFDGGLIEVPECPLGGDEPGTNPILGNIYVLAHNWNVWMSAIEYKVNWPAQLIYTGDVIANPDWLVLGGSLTGISYSFGTPVNAYNDFTLQTIKFIWNCSGCSTAQNITVMVVGHPASPEPPSVVRAVDFWSEEYVYGIGMSAIVCPTVPVEETTWGGIKALYNE
jgi:hypothetical protein